MSISFEKILNEKLDEAIERKLNVKLQPIKEFISGSSNLSQNSINQVYYSRDIENMFSVGRQKVYNWRKSGIIKGVQISDKKWIYLQKDIDNLLDTN